MSTTVPPEVAHTHIALAGTHNFRGIGSHPAGVGRRVRDGKIYRSDALNRLTDDARATLTRLGVATVVDLRTDEECAAAPAAVDSRTVTVVRSPIFHGSLLSMLGSEITLAQLYRVMVSEHGTQLASAVRSIARSGDSAVLVNCTAGKDRTGLVVALALSAAGVHRDAVIADYALTSGYLAGGWKQQMLAHFTAAGVATTPELEDLIVGSPPELLGEVFDLLEAAYGDVAGYLASHGLSAIDLELLRSVLTTPDTTETKKDHHG